MRLILLALAGCGDKSDDSGTEVLSCTSADETSLTIGYGVSDEFTPYESEATVGLSVAPQGGFGVTIRASTTGLAEGVVSVLLETAIDGEVVGSFLNESVTLYCQDDGTGLLWGVVVGFDPSTYATNDDLLALDGEVVDLVVTATDTSGVSATGTVPVTINVGG
jgi:hypothetical protein